MVKVSWQQEHRKSGAEQEEQLLSADTTGRSKTTADEVHTLTAAREGGAGMGAEGSEVTSGVQPHQPHLSPGGAEELQQLVAGPHQQLVPGADDTAAVEQDAAFVLDGQQVHLSFVPGKVDVPAREGCGCDSQCRLPHSINVTEGHKKKPRGRADRVGYLIQLE